MHLFGVQSSQFLHLDVQRKTHVNEVINFAIDNNLNK